MKGVVTILFLLVSNITNGQHIVLRDSVRKQPAVRPGMRLICESKLPVATIPQDQYTRCFGFFCRQELRMQKANIPVTFRLGSMEMTNRLEGKIR